MKNLVLPLLGILLIALLKANGKPKPDTEKDPSRPNILFIYSDDHTFQAISAYKSFLSGVIATPNIDCLSAEGMHFENAFCTNSICSPARTSVLTEKYSNRNGMKTIEGEFDGSQQTFPTGRLLY